MITPYKETFEKKLQSIANNLQFDLGSITNLGLINGKMGQAIFFYKYSRFANKLFYEELADKLIDEIFDQIKHWSVFDFANGLTGIGWGIEYLVREKFVEADTDEVLEDIDKVLKKWLFQNLVSIQNQEEIYGFGLYYLSRLSGKEISKNSLNMLEKKHILVYLHEDCERLLKKGMLFNFTLPELKNKQLNSIVCFLTEMHILNLYPIKIKKVTFDLLNYVVNVVDDSYVENHTLIQLLNKLCLNIEDFVLKERCLEVVSFLSQGPLGEVIPSTKEKIIEEYIKVGWNSLFYQVDLIKHGNTLISQNDIFHSLNDDSFWFKLSQNKNQELTGLGISLLNMMPNR